MAWKVNKIMQDQSCSDKDMFLLIMGSGHMGYHHGVPERLYRWQPELKNRACRIIARSVDDKISFKAGNGNDVEGLNRVFGCQADAADICFLYEEEEDIESVKAETEKSYNKVGGTAHIEGNLLLAKKAQYIH